MPTRPAKPPAASMQHAHAVCQPARPAHRDDPCQKPHGLAEGDRQRQAVARGNGHVPLQGHHRQQSSRPDAVCTEDRNQGCLLGAEPDDQPRHASVATDLLKSALGWRSASTVRITHQRRLYPQKLVSRQFSHCPYGVTPGMRSLSAGSGNLCDLSQPERELIRQRQVVGKAPATGHGRSLGLWRTSMRTGQDVVAPRTAV